MFPGQQVPNRPRQSYWENWAPRNRFEKQKCTVCTVVPITLILWRRQQRCVTDLTDRNTREGVVGYSRQAAPCPGSTSTRPLAYPAFAPSSSCDAFFSDAADASACCVSPNRPLTILLLRSADEDSFVTEPAPSYSLRAGGTVSVAGRSIGIALSPRPDAADGRLFCACCFLSCESVVGGGGGTRAEVPSTLCPLHFYFLL